MVNIFIKNIENITDYRRKRSDTQYAFKDILFSIPIMVKFSNKNAEYQGKKRFSISAFLR